MEIDYKEAAAKNFFIKLQFHNDSKTVSEVTPYYIVSQKSNNLQ